jgi:hypothetical protein
MITGGIGEPEVAWKVNDHGELGIMQRRWRV